jgi:hypothetical protein
MSLEQELMGRPEYQQDLFRSYGPGKFNYYADSYVYELSLDGGGDEEIGDVETTGYYVLVKGPFEHPQLKKFAGAILVEDNLGFVGVNFIRGKKKLASTWKHICGKVEQELDEINDHDPE